MLKHIHWFDNEYAILTVYIYVCVCVCVCVCVGYGIKEASINPGKG